MISSTNESPDSLVREQCLGRRDGDPEVLVIKSVSSLQLDSWPGHPDPSQLLPSLCCHLQQRCVQLPEASTQDYFPMLRYHLPQHWYFPARMRYRRLHWRHLERYRLPGRRPQGCRDWRGSCPGYLQQAVQLDFDSGTGNSSEEKLPGLMPLLICRFRAPAQLPIFRSVPVLIGLPLSEQDEIAFDEKLFAGSRAYSVTNFDSTNRAHPNFS